jgi:hypothetical protein
MLAKIFRKNKISFAILLFLAMFSIIHYLKPSLLYNDEGGFRPFGVGYRHKTVIRIWMAAIILALFSYMFVEYVAYNI